MKQIEIFTDGACVGNPGPGGWAALLRWEGHEKEISGHAEATTNNRMELQAVIEALNALHAPCKVDIYTDSEYVRRGMTEWLKSWKARGWKTADRKPVANRELWEILELAALPHEVNWHWVRGHDGHPENERVDELARKAAQKV